MKAPLLASAMILLTACSSSPTGRTQLKLYPSSQMDSMGASSFVQIKDKEKVSTNTQYNRYVQCIADAITAHVGKDVHDGSWEVVVFDSEQANAFAVPSGKIGVYTGLIKVTENQHQLAAVMGHEVAHVIAEHANERISSQSIAQTGMALADALLEDYDEGTQQMVMSGLGLGVQYGVLMPYSRTHESEADIIGQNLMAKAGFDPKESVELWRNMAKQSDGAPPEFMSTHPSSSTRINQLSEHLSVSMPIYQASQQKPNCK